MSTVIITGVGGLVGSTVARKFHSLGLQIIGIDNDMRSQLFGVEASVSKNLARLEMSLPNLTLINCDIRNNEQLLEVFQKYSKETAVIVHAAAQPSHDWAAKDPLLDFNVNAVATVNLLELTRQNCPSAIFVYMSTNKVYGAHPNSIELVENSSRWTPSVDSPWITGISEEMDIDNSTHSVFGASKVAADIMVQEYGRYFGLRTVSFRGGCLTGPSHSGAELHGFLSYLVKCTVWGRPYTVYGYKAKQVRDNLHSEDLAEAIILFCQRPIQDGPRFNIGGGLTSNISMLEAIWAIEELSKKKLNYEVSPNARKGDHKWYVTDNSAFQSAYPEWSLKYNNADILSEMVDFELSSKRRHP